MQDIVDTIVQKIEERILIYTEELYEWNQNLIYYGLIVFASITFVSVNLLVVFFNYNEKRVSFQL